MLDNDVSAKVLEALNPLKPWNRMEQLNSHWTQNLCKWKIETHSHVWPHDMCFFTNRSSMQEEQVSAGSWVLHSIFNEVNNSVAFELRETAKAEVTCTKICIGKTILFNNNKTQTLDNFKILTLVVFYSDMANKPVEFEGEAARSTLKYSPKWDGVKSWRCFHRC